MFIGRNPGWMFWVLEKTVFLIWGRKRGRPHSFPLLRRSLNPPPRIRCWEMAQAGSVTPSTLDHLPLKPRCVLGGGLVVPPSPGEIPPCFLSVGWNCTSFVIKSIMFVTSLSCPPQRKLVQFFWCQTPREISGEKKAGKQTADHPVRQSTWYTFGTE